ncbi:putative muscarinic acetylcholine receptor M3-like [Apostichopus japonicus]|uniref:Putative muscarinic acetylcholine receptor M3-like n=1 Tax=Stichopus japonicus TaxID=307972 RepID=A0A2G8LF21_STIJA|nr:putative muscarinic acetylcholine receptor M3-like [Apostichopus japonicus]
MNSSVSYTNTDNGPHTLPFTFTNDDSDPVWTTGSSPIYPWTLSPGFDVVASIPWYLLTLGTILANGITLFVFTKEKKLRSHVNYYVMNLALADLCVGIFVMPVYAVVVMLEWYWPIFGFYGCKVFQGIGYSLVTVSNLTVLVISGDRFYAVVSPLNYFKNVVRRGLNPRVRSRDRHGWHLVGSGDVNVDKETYRLNDLQGAVCVVKKMNNLNILKNGWPTSEFVDGIHRLPGQNTEHVCTRYYKEPTGSRMDAIAIIGEIIIDTKGEFQRIFDSFSYFVGDCVIIHFIMDYVRCCGCYDFCLCED